MAFQLRSLQNSDHSLIKDIYQDSLIMRHIGCLLSDQQVSSMFETMLGEITHKKAVYQVIITSENNSCAGLLSMHWRSESESIISGMIVLPEFQNQGVCKWAQFAAMKMIKHHFPVKTCTVYISTDNVAASTSYKNMGFVQVVNTLQSKKHLNLIRWDFNMELMN